MALTSCTENYTPYLNAQLNALDFYGHDKRLDFYLVAIDMAPAYLTRIREADWSFNLVIRERKIQDYEHLGDSKNLQSKKARYTELARILSHEHYDAACNLDADLFPVRNIMPFFEMVAGTEAIIGANERIKWFMDEFSFRGKRLPRERMTWMVCNCPLFFDPAAHTRFLATALEASTGIWNENKQSVPSDLFTMNLALYLSGAYTHVIQLPAHAWTGVHTQYLDVRHRITKNGDGFVTDQGEPVYMIHGRWDREATWRGMQNELEKRYNELGMDEEKKHRQRALAKATIRQIREQFEYFNTQRKVKLEV